MKTEIKNQDWRKGPARPLLRLFQDSLHALDAYFTGEKNIEIIIDGMRVGREWPGPVRYDLVIQAYENLDGYLGQLGAFVVAGDIPKEDFNRLVYQRNILVRLCEDKRKYETGVKR